MNSRPFNIFRALRLDQHEIRHSNFLAWLLHPGETHEQGDLFLRAVLQAVTTPRGVGVHAGDRAPIVCKDAHVGREVDSLDVRIVLPSIRVVVGIENKLFTSEHSQQLRRYADCIARDFAGWRHVLIYLTLDGEDPSNARWQALSHRQLNQIIASSIPHLDRETPLDVCAFIQHYLDLLSDVYKRREALTANPRLSQVIQTIVAAIEELKGWQVVSSSSALIECGPNRLFETLPAIGTKRGRDARQWLTLRFHDHGANGYIGRYWRPSEVSDRNHRNSILQALVAQGAATGFKYKNGTTEAALSGDQPAFSGDRIQDLRTGQVPNALVLRDMIHRELRSIESRLDVILQIIMRTEK
ncbi:MAG: PD-(D/E)XK nuclease family protein [Phycisphaerales bacterium]